MYRVATNYDIEIAIDGTNYSFNSQTGSTIDNFFLFEATVDAVPTIELTLIDNYGISDVVPVHDNSLIEVTLFTLTGNFYVLQNQRFRVWSVKIDPASNQDRVTIIAYLDVPGYLRQQAYTFQNSSSSNVVSSNGTPWGLTVEVDNSNDSQTYLQHGLTGYLWTRELAKHAWASKSSAFSMAATRGGVLRYYDLGKRTTNPKPTFTLVENDDAVNLQGVYSRVAYPPDRTVVTASQIRQVSGLLNFYRGYGVFGILNSATSGLSSLVSPSGIPSFGGALNVGEESYSPHNSYQPIDVGNTHDNYFVAQMQNEQILSTYNVNYRCLTTRLIDINLLDCGVVQSRLGRTGALRDSINSNIWFVDRLVWAARPSGLTQFVSLMSNTIKSVDKNLISNQQELI